MIDYREQEKKRKTERRKRERERDKWRGIKLRLLHYFLHENHFLLEKWV